MCGVPVRGGVKAIEDNRKMCSYMHTLTHTHTQTMAEYHVCASLIMSHSHPH